MPTHPNETELFSEPVSLATFQKLVDFQSEGIEEVTAKGQALGTVALHNILCREQVAYLADEVGMGKTYQALGLIALTWHFKPDARILVVAPRAAVQEKWHRDYANFVSKNVLVADNRIRDVLLGRPVHRAHLCSNLIELAKQMLDNPQQLFLTRLSSFSFLASSLKVRSKEIEVTAGDVTKALHKKGLFVSTLDESASDQTLDGAQAQNVECARQMLELLPTFDLIVVDEAQKLRNKGNNIFTRVFTTLLGLRADEKSKIRSTQDMPHLLLMSATPAHRTERDIYTQLSYADAEATKVPERTPESRQQYLDRFFIRRLRRLAGKSKYAYRVERAVARKSSRQAPEAVVDELFVALVQKRLEGALANREHLNTSLKIGFLESFESYKPSEVELTQEQEGEDESGEKTTAATHYDTTDEHVAPDRAVLQTLAQHFYESTGSRLPPHPKQRLIDDAARRSFRADEPEKLLIFVRRLASVRELRHRICSVYDEVTLQRLFRTIGPERIERRLMTAQIRTDGAGLDQFRNYVELVLGRGSDEVFATDVDEDEVGEQEISQSRVLEIFAQQQDRATAGQLFVRRFSQSGSLAGVFEENFLRLAFDLLKRSGTVKRERFEDFVDHHIDDTVIGAINRYLVADRKAAQKGQTPFYYRRRGEYFTLHESRTRILVHKLAMLRICERFDHRLVDKLREMTGFFHEAPQRLDEPLPQDQWLETSEKIREFLVATSFWDLARHCEQDHRPFIQWVRAESRENKSIGEILERRETLKRIIEKNFRVSEAVLDLFIAYDRAAGESVEAVAAELLNLLLSSSGSRTRKRIDELIVSQVPLMSLLESRVSSENPIYTETRWNDFDRQEPASGVMGGTSSRTSVMIKFNSPFFPDFLITTDVFREGVDLHLACKRVWHYGMVASPGDIEQRSGRIDRYFSKVHRGLIRHEESAEDKRDTELEIGYPYLARSVDEHQVIRVLKRKRDVQPLLDKGLAYHVREELDLDRRDDDSIGSLIAELNETKDEGQYEPFPTSRHIDAAEDAAPIVSKPRVTLDFQSWLLGTFERLTADVPLVPDEHKLAKDTRHGRDLSNQRLLTNLNLAIYDGRSIVVDGREHVGDELRQQPVMARLGFIPSIRHHFLRLTTPLGSHGEDVAVVLRQQLQELAPWTACKIVYNPTPNAYRRHWQLAAVTDLLFCTDSQNWPSYNSVRQRLIELAQTADELERSLVDLTEQAQDLTYLDALEIV